MYLFLYLEIHIPFADFWIFFFRMLMLASILYFVKYLILLTQSYMYDLHINVKL